ncbi:aminodeoxychorismate synthase component I [Blastomonas aquatica]|uniref:Probable branched-chain-amino-acid aminotransferase n=1 Tax=Blastomonas aquatica TaxID=1510276 RepID=A0ABQ1JCZ8_9SPHN|nr:aminodeoxychorismate synthase component I [Blastomonas aquatica]GGB65261.1 aminodeoxychorismate synthase, component I [Blastomonas aquatica]
MDRTATRSHASNAPTPFVLLDDARTDHASAPRLYRDPVRCLSAATGPELDRLLDDLREAARQGLHAAGCFAYEAGLALEPRLRPLLEDLPPMQLAWFGLFTNYDVMTPDEVDAWLLDAGGSGEAFLTPARPAMSEADYAARFARVHACIASGDIYQANLTFQNAAAISGHPLALYRALRGGSAAGYGGVVFDGADWQLSLSPELFFSLRNGEVTARPMKGTAPRHKDPERDAEAARALAASQKDRAENLMIVDLLRNDLSRIAAPGSVSVTDLFRIESYPTVHQMTSTVRAAVAPGLDAVDILRAIFPCGSITGAPKIRAMELLHQIEAGPRGIYCGSIGRIDPAQQGQPGDAAFNVAIRTLHLAADTQKVSVGLGSGVVADSTTPDEWRECLVKGAFLKAATKNFDLIETMGFDPAQGIVRLELHLERMKASAAELGFSFDRHAVRNALNHACFYLDAPTRIRLLLAATGDTAIEMRPAPAPIAEPLQVVIRAMGLSPDDIRLAHKTTDRACYDQPRHDAYADCGADEVVFADADGALTEGSFTSLFVERDGKLLTPPLAKGLLPGILRSELINQGRAVEAALTERDLAGGFWLGNSLRGLMQARVLP